MSLESASKQMQALQKGKETLDVFLREVEVDPEDGLKFLDKMLKEQERHPCEPRIGYVFYKKEQYDSLKIKGVPFRVFYDPQEKALHYRIVM